MHKLRTIHLFAGAGGGILADLLLGHHPICAVEINPYCQQVLHARQKDGILPWFPIFGDVQEFDGNPWRGLADVVCGGFPCQDISAAGKGAGIDGAKSGLWNEMARVVREVGPRYVFVENSPMLTSRGLGRVLGDLAEMGYDARWGVLGANDAGAPHYRKRIWILANARYVRGRNGTKPTESRVPAPSGLRVASDALANAECTGLEGLREQGCADPSGGGPWRTINPPEGGCNVADSDSKRLDGKRLLLRQEQDQTLEVTGSSGDVSNAKCERQSRPWPHWYASDPAEAREGETDFTWNERVGNIWGLESRLGRVANGVANRMDRLIAIGNGQIPSVAALAWRTLIGQL